MWRYIEAVRARARGFRYDWILSVIVGGVGKKREVDERERVCVCVRESCAVL